MGGIFAVNSTTIDPLVIDIYDKSISALDEYYSLTRKIRPNVFILPDKATFNSIRGKETPPGLVCWAKGNNVFLIDRSAYTPEIEWKKEDRYFRGDMMHSIAHLYFIAASRASTSPKWLDEGLSMYLSGQNKLRRPMQGDFTHFLEYFESYDPNLYKEAGFAVEILDGIYGKDPVVTLVKSLPFANSREKFDSTFKEIFGFLPTYERFNELKHKHFPMSPDMH